MSAIDTPTPLPSDDLPLGAVIMPPELVDLLIDPFADDADPFPDEAPESPDDFDFDPAELEDYVPTPADKAQAARLFAAADGCGPEDLSPADRDFAAAASELAYRLAAFPAVGPTKRAGPARAGRPGALVARRGPHCNDRLPHDDFNHPDTRRRGP
jgi:hypothetical protein